MKVFNGKPVSAGVMHGPLHFYCRASKELERRMITDIDAELARFEQARQESIEQLGKLYEKALTEAGEDAAMLFETHQMMLDDPDFCDLVTESIKKNMLCAEASVHDAGEQMAEMLAAMDDAYMQARSADVRDIASRVVQNLTGHAGSGVTFDEPCIVAADDLAPSETVQLDKSKILGFVMSAGTPNSHTAILARTMGIPAVMELGPVLDASMEGQEIFVDGQTGEVIIDADPAATERLLKKMSRERAQKELMETLRGQPNETIDGRTVMVYANIGSPDDVDAVLSNDAGGIGLFRSEFLYLQSTDYPTEEQQFQAYKTVAERMNGKRVIIRTLDIGADKQADYFKLGQEQNPAMGLRAIRICLTRPEVFKTQLRALYRASAYGKIAIMFPMITSMWEVLEIKRICGIVRSELEKESIPFGDRVELGIMIETPAAVLIAPELAQEVDFFSIGTNDLTQYTLAIDRQGESALDRFFDAHHPAVLRLIGMTVDAAHSAGIWAGICGELGADLSLTKQLLKLGVDELSVSPAAVLPLRSAIRGINLTE